MSRSLKTEYLLLLLILLLAAFIRFYRLAEMANFDFDQEYASNFAYSVLKVFPIQLIGQGLSVEGLFMGPWYFYYLVPFFALTHLHPIGGFAASVLLGLLTIAAYFWVGKRLFGINGGLIAAFLRAIFFNKIDGDWGMVPAYSSELTALVTWFCFYKYWHGQLQYLPLLFLSFGLFTSIHPILFPFYLVFVVLILIRRKVPNFKTALLSLIALILPLIPLIIFEYFHKFLEIRRLFSVYSGGSQEARDFTRFLNYLNLNIKEIYNLLGLQFIPWQFFIILFFGLIFILVIKKIDFWGDKFHIIALAISWSVFLTYYTLIQTHVSEYYFQGLFTLSLLYIGGLLGLLNRNKLTPVILFLILTNIFFVNFQALHERWNNPSLVTLYHKDFIVQQIAKHQPKDQEFFISYIKLPGWNFGFDYLFKLYGLRPQTKEAKPPIYTIVIPKFLSPGSSDIESGNIGLILPKK